MPSTHMAPAGTPAPARTSPMRFRLVWLACALVVLAVASCPASVSGQRLFISTYYHSSTVTAIEIFNPSCASVTLTNFKLRIAPYSNHSTGAVWGSAISLGTGSLLARSAGSICSASLTGCTGTDSTVSVTGYDAIGLFHNNVLIDVIGSITGMAGTPCGNCVGGVTDTAAPWTVNGTRSATRLHTLVRASRVTEGKSDWFDPLGAVSEHCPAMTAA